MATARCHPKDKADNRGVAEGEDGYVDGTTDLPVGIHFLQGGRKRIHIFHWINTSNHALPVIPLVINMFRKKDGGISGCNKITSE